MKVLSAAQAAKLNKTETTEPYLAANGHMMVAPLRFPRLEDGFERNYQVGDEIQYESWQAWCVPACPLGARPTAGLVGEREMNVRVFINDCWTVGDDPESHWFGYRDWHEPFLRLAIEYEVPVGRDNDVLEEAFRLFNVDESDERALRYRADRNRSLSVGDVVEINGRRYACQMVGWESISCGEDGHEWETNYPLRECLTCGLVNEAPEPIYGGEDE